jgi:hypothetical protein
MEKNNLKKARTWIYAGIALSLVATVMLVLYYHSPRLQVRLQGELFFPGFVYDGYDATSSIYKLDLSDPSSEPVKVLDTDIDISDPFLYSGSMLCNACTSGETYKVLRVTNGKIETVLERNDGADYWYPVETEKAICYLTHIPAGVDAANADQYGDVDELVRYDKTTKKEKVIATGCDLSPLSENDNRILYTVITEALHLAGTENSDAQDYAYQIHLYDSNTDTDVTVTEGMLPFWYDSQTFFYEGEGGLFSYDLTTKAIKPVLKDLLPIQMISSMPVVSPDKKYIAFAYHDELSLGNIEPIWRLYVMSLSSGKYMEIKQFAKVNGAGGNIIWVDGQ